jgi:aspartate dehydrogenase
VPLKSSYSRIAVIGFGAITSEIVRGLAVRQATGKLVAILGRPGTLWQLEAKAKNSFPVFDSLDAVLALQPDLIVEAASHEALIAYGPAILSRGIDLLVSSAGALANRNTFSELSDSAVRGAEIWIPAGAVAGIDGLLAARTAGLRHVRYTSLKTPAAWNGTPGEAAIKDIPVGRRVFFFQGTAREAAISFPRNANVGATIALAGLGFDHTEVHLGADCMLAGPLGILDAVGTFGSLHIETLGLATEANPKTSMLTGHSIVSALLDGMCFGALGDLRRLKDEL